METALQAAAMSLSLTDVAAIDRAAETLYLERDRPRRDLPGTPEELVSTIEQPLHLRWCYGCRGPAMAYYDRLAIRCQHCHRPTAQMTPGQRASTLRQLPPYRPLGG